MSDLTRRRFAAGCLVAAALLWSSNAGYLPGVGLHLGTTPNATFVLVDHWEDRATNAGFRSLGTNAAEWDQIRGNGSAVLNVDAGSPEAEKYAKQTAGGVPVLIAFDGDKPINATRVNSIADVRAAYTKTTGKKLGGN